MRDLADIIGVNSSVCDHKQVEEKAGNQPWNKVVGKKVNFSKAKQSISRVRKKVKMRIIKVKREEDGELISKSARFCCLEFGHQSESSRARAVCWKI